MIWGCGGCWVGDGRPAVACLGVVVCCMLKLYSKAFAVPAHEGVSDRVTCHTSDTLLLARLSNCPIFCL